MGRYSQTIICVSFVSSFFCPKSVNNLNIFYWSSTPFCYHGISQVEYVDLNQRGLRDFPITKGVSPNILEHKLTAMRSFDIFPPAQSSPEKYFFLKYPCKIAQFRLS